MRRESLREALIKGSKLIVIDPKEIDIAKRADLWIRPRGPEVTARWPWVCSR